MTGLLSFFDDPVALLRTQHAAAELIARERSEAGASRRAAEAQAQDDAAWRALDEALDRLMAEEFEAELADDLSPATKKAYRADISRWRAWCVDEGVSFLPGSPQKVRAFLLSFAGTGDRLPPMRAVWRMLSAIGHLHKLAQFPNPCDDVRVRATVRYLRDRHDDPPEDAEPTPPAPAQAAG